LKFAIFKVKLKVLKLNKTVWKNGWEQKSGGTKDLSLLPDWLLQVDAVIIWWNQVHLHEIHLRDLLHHQNW